jgi:GNAT superfamily N-acetyltransferase
MKPEYKQEFLHTCRYDAEELLKMHYNEIALNKDKIKLNPDWESYEKLEELGKLSIFTVRDNGKLVGYFVLLVSTSLHYVDHVYAISDIIYVHPDYRKGFLGVRLLKFAERCLKKDGVSIVMVNTKIHKPFGKILSRIGYNPIETVYSKYIGD